MNKLDIDFAFEGFRIIRERPWLILVWGIVMLAFHMLLTAGLTAFVKPAVIAFNAVSQAPPSQDPAQALAMMGNLAQVYGIIFPLSFVFQSILACAVYRSVLGDRKASFGFLRVGGAELLQVGFAIVMLLVVIVAGIGCVLAGTIVGLILSMILGLFAPAAGSICIIGGVVLGYGVLVWLLIRLSLASVQTFAEGKLNLFGSWELTKGHGWTLFGGYLIMVIMVFLVSLLCFAIFAAVVIGLAGGDFSALSPVIHSGLPLLEDLADPLLLSYHVLSSLIITPLFLALWLGAPAGAYKQLIGTTRTQAENLF